MIVFKRIFSSMRDCFTGLRSLGIGGEEPSRQWFGSTDLFPKAARPSKAARPNTGPATSRFQIGFDVVDSGGAVVNQLSSRSLRSKWQAASLVGCRAFIRRRFVKRSRARQGGP